MAVAITITSSEESGQNAFIGFNMALSGNYVAGGDTLDFTKATIDPSFVGTVPQVMSSGAPNGLSVWVQGGDTAAHMLANQFIGVLGSAMTNCKLVISAASTFGTEYSAGAYDAGIKTLKLAGQITFPKNI